MIAFEERVQRTSTCWTWTGARLPTGYGTLTTGSRRDGSRRKVYAHRLSWELHRGAIPDGMQIDHLCRVRHCVNPDHLDVVTSRENSRRGAEARQLCRRGLHRYGPGNIYTRPDGYRECRACRAAAERRRRR